MITLYRNARLIDANGDRYGDLCTQDGSITSCAPLGWQRADRVIDMRRNALMPAFIDLHCHLRDPGYPEKETMETGMRAALTGGYAHRIAMATTSDSRQPSVNRINKLTLSTAMPMWNNSSLDFSAAVSP